MDPRFAELEARLAEVHDLSMASALLYWDQATYMPPGGAAARGRQLALLRRLAHETFTDPALGKLLEELAPEAEGHDPHSFEASLVRVTLRDYERAVRIPAEFTARLAEHAAASYEAWARARPADDFQSIRPFLERTLELSSELAGYFPESAHIADPLIDLSDRGMTVTRVQALFEELRRELVPLVEAITAQPPADDGCLHQRFPEPEQLAFAARVVRDFGYDFQRGRLDKTRHPFMTRFAVDDVRITTRVNENDLSDGLFSTFHEAGHALQYQGVDPALDGTPLSGTASAGVAESQSRLWENLVGRSRPFWEHYFPRLQEAFPAQLGQVGLDGFYRAVNKVERSLLRTEADEVTYNLHVMIRFELELELLEGRLEVGKLPESWRDRYERDLGIRPPSDRDGVLQDVHWYHGALGGDFQGYTLGNLLAAQIYERALEAHPEIPDQTGGGRFDTLLDWLTENVYVHGRKYTPSELVERVTGCEHTIRPYVDYLRGKYGELYDL